MTELKQDANSSLDFMTKAMVAASLISSILATALNLIMLGRWDLPYAVIASASDIFSGVIQAALAVSLGILAIPIVALVPKNMQNFIHENEKIFLLFSIMIIFLMATISLVFLNFEKVDIGDDPLLTIGLLNFFCLVASSIICRSIFSKELPILLMCIVVMFIINQILIYLNINYQAILINRPNGPCPQYEYLVWAGSERLVTSCSPPPFGRDGAFHIFDRDGIEMIKRPSEVARNAKTH